ncbi:MAG: HAD family phosphatase, partial [Verrucomicrobiae bacterium]|nr:HAD family phosphatase [Verrucomicrobiae bacterium]
ALDILKIREYFDAIVSGEDVKHGKPDPEVFLLAAKRIGKKPEECVVFEDAHVGIEAGLKGGMKVVALATTHPPHTLKDANIVVLSFKDLLIEDIDRLFYNGRM